LCVGGFSGCGSNADLRRPRTAAEYFQRSGAVLRRLATDLRRFEFLNTDQVSSIAVVYLLPFWDTAIRL
jgi:hypothetical protein